MTDDEIRALLEGASLGPWQTYRKTDVCNDSGHIASAEFEDDASLIAAAPSLAAEVLRLREALREAAEMLRFYNANFPHPGADEILQKSAAALKGAAE